MEISVETIKQLRDETGSPVMEIRKALSQSHGDEGKAREILKEQGALKAEKKADRVTAQGLVETYVHGGGKVGVIVEIGCETDFVARTEEFKKLAHEVAMQIAAMNPTSLEELQEQEYIRDPRLKIKDLVHEIISKTGENIKIKRFTRFALGEDA